MARLPDNYTRYPRPLLWLVRGGSLGDVEIEPFYLSKRPVTNRQFEAYDRGHRRSEFAPTDDDPATGVTFEAARGYCEWYARVSRKPMRLPTTVEWEYAAATGDGEANRFGLVCMLGGPWEWAITAEGTGVLRGGSSQTPAAELRPDLRRVVDACEEVEDAGFRIARSLRSMPTRRPVD